MIPEIFEGGKRMNAVLEKETTDVLEPDLMDVLDLLQGRVADFDENYHIKNIPIVVACGNNPCSGACGRSCSDDCEYTCGGTSA
jgi:hypothetical protein